MSLVRCDFETRSQLDVRDVGPYIYASHPSTEIMCIAFSIDDGPIHLWHPFAGKTKIPEELEYHVWRNAQIESHNVMFERCIWNIVAKRQFGWPKLNHLNLNCSAAKAAAMALPRSLEGLGAALNTSIQKDSEGKRLMQRLSKPRKPTKADSISLWHEKPEDLNALFKYCKNDVATEREASKMLHPLSTFEKQVWQLNQEINWRGIKIDRKAVESAICLIDSYRDELKSELPLISGNAITKPGQLKRIHEFLESRKVFLPDLKAETVDGAIKQDYIKDPDCKRILEIRRALSKSSVDKYWAMKDRMSDKDDRVRNVLVYHGASTGRESGSGIQIHNLPRGIPGFNQDECIEIMKLQDLDLFKSCYENPLAAISSCLRGMIIADRGKILKVVDYNAIEARAIMWLAECKTGLDDFKNEHGPYKLMAADIYGKKPEEITKEERFLGKTVVLGAGYQLGPNKFKASCASYGVQIEDSFAAKVIARYRERYKEVKNFWYNLESAAMRCVLSKRSTECGPVEFSINGMFLTCRLPSGRLLYYCDPSVREQETSWGVKDSVHFRYIDSQTKQWTDGPIYGGLWAENITQATARDILMVACLKLKQAGHTVLFSVHDEIVTEDPENAFSLKDMESIILDVPKWSKGLPLALEGFESFRYRK